MSYCFFLLKFKIYSTKFFMIYSNPSEYNAVNILRKLLLLVISTVLNEIRKNIFFFLAYSD